MKFFGGRDADSNATCAVAPARGSDLGTPPVGTPAHTLFQPLPPQPAPLPGIYLNTVPGNKGVYLTTGDTLGQAIPLSHVHHMAMGPRLSDTNKPRHSLGNVGGVGSGRGSWSPL